MPLPRIAIVGRPNVGKSSLLNLIAGSKVSIVDPTPGVTRDRVTAIVDLLPPDNRDKARTVELIDTGGFGVYTAEGGRFDEIGEDLGKLTASIEYQIAEAVRSADLVLFAIDAQAGITPQDSEIARLLREGKYAGEGGKARRHEGTEGEKTPYHKPPPVQIVATKVDGPKWETHALEFSGLGFGEALMVSSKNNYLRREFLDRLWELAGQVGPGPSVPEEPAVVADIKLAIVGKRNAGKSTMVNTLAGEPRMIVSEIAGTTRDAVDVRLELDGKSLIVIDTAGLRKKKSFQNQIEWYALDRLERSIERADVVLVLIDATTDVSQVDQQLAMMVQKAFKPAVIVVNKWDLVDGKRGPNGKIVTTIDFEKYIRKELRGLDFAPIAFTSGLENLNVKETIDLAHDLHEQAGRRVTTGKLNRWLREVIESRPPPNKLGTRPKVYFVAQTGVRPVTIVLVVNRPELFAPNYQRFLLNRLRETLPFPEVPIRLVVRERRRDRDDVLERAGRRMHDTGEKDLGPLVDEFDESAEALLSDEESAVVEEFGDLEGAEDAGEFFDDEP
ncbi:MAG: ribosome biogenesis GTPase Der [Phycisphaerales bacterium]|nr:ribosome biogenesis GTPase Der [Phycisphaerales bacterium]